MLTCWTLSTGPRPESTALPPRDLVHVCPLKPGNHQDIPSGHTSATTGFPVADLIGPCPLPFCGRALLRHGEASLVVRSRDALMGSQTFLRTGHQNDTAGSRTFVSPLSEGAVFSAPESIVCAMLVCMVLPVTASGLCSVGLPAPHAVCVHALYKTCCVHVCVQGTCSLGLVSMAECSCWPEPPSASMHPVQTPVCGGLLQPCLFLWLTAPRVPDPQRPHFRGLPCL